MDLLHANWKSMLPWIQYSTKNIIMANKLMKGFCPGTFFCHSLEHSHTIPWNILIPFLGTFSYHSFPKWYQTGGIKDQNLRNSHPRSEDLLCFTTELLKRIQSHHMTSDKIQFNSLFSMISNDSKISFFFPLSFFLQWVVLIEFLNVIPVHSMATWSALGSGAVTLVSYLMTWHEMIRVLCSRVA